MEKRNHNHADSSSKRNLVWIAVLGFCVLFASSAGAQEREVIKFTRADVDGNGETDLADLFLASEYFQGEASVAVIETIDVINDGQITLGDLYALAHVISTPGPRGFDSEQEGIIRGDLNGDGRVTPRDSGRLDAYLRGDDRLYVVMDAADVNDDGRIDRHDQIALDNELGLGDPRKEEKDEHQPDPHKVEDSSASAQAPADPTGLGSDRPTPRPRRQDPDIGRQDPDLPFPEVASDPVRRPAGDDALSGGK